MKTAIDWAAKPEPWCRIGPIFRLEAEHICANAPPRPPEKHIDPAGMALRGRRVEAKLMQRELAALAGCSVSTIGGLETGRSTGSTGLWSRIDAALDEATGRGK